MSEWDDEEVSRRWVSLTPLRDEGAAARKMAAMLSNPSRIKDIRERLGSLSWFMKYVNEPIARTANREDKCTGRFWEGRFKSSALLDEGAVVGCMAYVDLNPIRAKICDRIEDAPHTSVARRITLGDERCAPLADISMLGLPLVRYRTLLEWTAAVVRGSVEPPGEQTVLVLRELGHQTADWLPQVKSHRLKYRAYGAAIRLRRYAKLLGQRWIKGSGGEKPISV